MRKKGMPRICPCGVNPIEKPHDLRMCAPTLERRLQKVADYLKQRDEYSMWCLSWGYQFGGGKPVITAFPMDPYSHNCVICGFVADVHHYMSVRSGGFDASICDECLEENKRCFCFYYMKEGVSSCIQPTSRIIFLCLLRLNLPMDIVRMIVRQYVFRRRDKCIHDQ